MDLMSMLPTGTISLKMGLGLLTSRVVVMCGHKVERYQVRLITKTKQIEFLVYHPGPKFPERYNNVTHSHLYFISDASEIFNVAEKEIKKRLTDPAAVNGTVELFIIDIDRNEKEFPYQAFITVDGTQKIIKGSVS